MSSENYAFRLLPGEDLKNAIQSFVVTNNIQAGWIVSCVGSLTAYNIRTANQSIPTSRQGHFEILSLLGTVSKNGSHLHISVADEAGMTFGGHLLDGNLIYTTAEIVIGSSQELIFTREKDGSTQWAELSVNKSNPWRRRLLRIENLLLLSLAFYFLSFQIATYSDGLIFNMSTNWLDMLFVFFFFKNALFLIVLFFMHYILRLKAKRIKWICAGHVLLTVCIFIVFIIMGDYATSVVPGWHTTIYPPLSGLADNVGVWAGDWFTKIASAIFLLVQVAFVIFFVYQVIFSQSSGPAVNDRA